MNEISPVVAGLVNSEVCCERSVVRWHLECRYQCEAGSGCVFSAINLLPLISYVLKCFPIV